MADWLFNSSDAEDGIFLLVGNTMPADALASKVARASAGMALAVQDRWHGLWFLKLPEPQQHGIGCAGQITWTVASKDARASAGMALAVQDR